MGDALKSVVAAAAVHVFTALGIVCALFAVLAVLAQAWEAVFLWLGVALVIDGIDGFFARLVDVGRRLPRFSGERLDQIIDYVTYVFIPVLALLHAGFLPGAAGIILACLILLSSLFHFCDLDNKAEDHCFVGFPAIWNIVAFYVFAFATPAWLTMAVVLICVGLTFVPMRWVHPLRVATFRLVTVGLTALWGLAAAWTIWRGFPAHPMAQAVLASAGLYAAGLTVAWPWIEPRRT
jgi:phosphatidylcholine synthase